MKSKIESIELLRIIVAVSLAFFHSGTLNGSGLSLASGVDLLLCISAFLAMLTTSGNTKKHYVIKRLVRTMPLYWIMTILTFAAAQVMPELLGGQGTPEFVDLIKSLLLIPYTRGSLKSGTVIRPIVGLGWTLYYDIYFSAIFSIAMKIYHKHRGAIAIGTVSVLMLLGAVLPKDNAVFSVITSWLWTDFIAGILAFECWRIYQSLNLSNHTMKVIRVGTGGIALVCLGLLYDDAIEKNAIEASALAFGLLLCVLIALDGIRLPKVISFLGSLSFSFYLLHYYVVIVFSKVFFLQPLDVKSVLITFSAIVMAYILSWCSYKIIEQKLTHTIYNVLKM